MNENGTHDSFDDAIRDSVAPVLEQLEQARAEVADLEQRLVLARARVKRGERVLYALDPTLRPEKTDKPSKSSNRRADGSYPISEESISEVETWLRKNIGPEELFAGADLEKREDGPKRSSATVSAALNVLHERGVLTLDSVNRGGPGRRKNYRLAPSS